MDSAELAEMFDDDLADPVTIAGVATNPVMVISGAQQAGRSEYDGILRDTWSFTAQRADLAPLEIVVDRQLTINGITWKIDALGGDSQVVDISLIRRIT